MRHFGREWKLCGQVSPRRRGRRSARNIGLSFNTYLRAGQLKREATFKGVLELLSTSLILLGSRFQSSFVTTGSDLESSTNILVV